MTKNRKTLVEEKKDTFMLGYEHISSSRIIMYIIHSSLQSVFLLRVSYHPAAQIVVVRRLRMPNLQSVVKECEARCSQTVGSR